MANTENYVVVSNDTKEKVVSFSHPLSRLPLTLSSKQFFVEENPVTEERLPFFTRLEDLSLTVSVLPTVEERDELISQQTGVQVNKVNKPVEEAKEDVPNDVNPNIPTGAPVGEPIGFVESKDEVSDAALPTKEEEKAVGADYGSKNEEKNDVNPKIPAGAPVGETIGFAPETDSVAPPVEQNAVGTDFSSKNPEKNDVNPLIPAGAPVGQPIGFDLPTSIRENTVVEGASAPDTDSPVAEGEVDTTNGHADSSRQAVESLDALAQGEVEVNPNAANQVSVSEGEADSAAKTGLPDRPKALKVKGKNNEVKK